ncbi:MAG: hypothetical protein KKC03_13950 [Bacteroidetes bacterium]|nr:hypothetical protein [Bacteroidota bacterium]
MSYLDGSITVTTTGKTYHYKTREYRCGYKQALADAVAVVRKVPTLWQDDARLIDLDEAIAAITALEEK